MKYLHFKLILIALLVQACGLLPAAATPTLVPSATPTAVPSQTPTTTPTPLPSPTSTPDPYWTYTIDYLRSRSYGGGDLQIVQKVGTNSAFTRYLIRYPSDGLMIDGFMNIPNGDGTFPVIIALHGYIDPSIYKTFDYTTHYADALASAGYLVVHPNLRGYPPSDSGDNLFRVGMAIDVLNLIAILKATGGQSGPLQAADPARLGMWGHSMGGGITTRVITVSPDVKAAVLYSPMSGDEGKNYNAIWLWSSHDRGDQERQVPEDQLPRISPMYFFDYIQAPIAIYHSLADPLVPVQWSMLTCQQLKALGKSVECNYYDGQPHTFEGQVDKQFIQSTIQFFDRYLGKQ